jgi:hypothetical protein
MKTASLLLLLTGIGALSVPSSLSAMSKFKDLTEMRVYMSDLTENTYHSALSGKSSLFDSFLCSDMEATPLKSSVFERIFMDSYYKMPHAVRNTSDCRPI